MREGGMPLPLAFQYLILMAQRPCDLNLVTKSLSEPLILESVNPQYDERLFIEFHEKYKFRTCCVQILF